MSDCQCSDCSYGDGYAAAYTEYREGYDKLHARLTAAERVVEAARDLQRCGYDGPFIGDVCVPLFSAVNDYDKETGK